jgi:hypothetical protein
MKFCPRCKEKKQLDEFYKKKGRRAASYCKLCQHAYLREHYKKTSAIYNVRRYALHLKYTKRNRRLVLDHLARHPCVDCNESDVVVLDFDHIRGSKFGDVSRMIVGGTSQKRLQAEIDKCRSVCELPPSQDGPGTGKLPHEALAVSRGRQRRICRRSSDESLGRARVELATNGLKGRCSTG